MHGVPRPQLCVMCWHLFLHLTSSRHGRAEVAISGLSLGRSVCFCFAALQSLMTMDDCRALPLQTWLSFGSHVQGRSCLSESAGYIYWQT